MQTITNFTYSKDPCKFEQVIQFIQSTNKGKLFRIINDNKELLINPIIILLNPEFELLDNLVEKRYIEYKFQRVVNQVVLEKLSIFGLIEKYRFHFQISSIFSL